MKKVYHHYSLTSEWLQDIADQINSKVIADKLIHFPKKIGNGHSYFIPVNPHISVLFMDVVIKTPLTICRQKSDNELYIFHFDLSEHVNLIKINNQDYEIGSYDKLDLAIIDNKIDSSYEPALKEKTFAMRILVDKKLLSDFIAKSPKIEYKESLNDKVDKETFYHYGNIDSNSILLLQSLKTKSIEDLSFESFLKGVTLKLLGNFFSKFYDTEHKPILTQAESDAVNKTKKYMLSHLYNTFPSVIFLSSMAGMSESKYKMAFKENCGTTPNNFFIKEKMKLARELLKSGKYNSLTEVMYELSYSKLSYFSSKYFELFNNKPMDDFVKREHLKR